MWRGCRPSRSRRRAPPSPQAVRCWCRFRAPATCRGWRARTAGRPHAAGTAPARWRCRAAGRQRATGGGPVAGLPQCRWCGRAEPAFRCPACASRRLRAGVVGAGRTAEELGRAFPGATVRTSGGSAPVLDRVPARPDLVVATPGAEPPAEGGLRGGAAARRVGDAVAPGPAGGGGDAAALDGGGGAGGAGRRRGPAGPGGRGRGRGAAAGAGAGPLGPGLARGRRAGRAHGGRVPARGADGVGRGHGTGRRRGRRRPSWARTRRRASARRASRCSGRSSWIPSRAPTPPPRPGNAPWCACPARRAARSRRPWRPWRPSDRRARLPTRSGCASTRRRSADPATGPDAGAAGAMAGLCGPGRRHVRNDHRTRATRAGDSVDRAVTRSWQNRVRPRCPCWRRTCRGVARSGADRRPVRVRRLGGTDPGVPTGAPARSCRRRSVPVQPVRLFGDPVLRTPSVRGHDLRRGAAQAGRRPDRHDARGGRRRARRAAAGRRAARVRLRLRGLRRPPGQPDVRGRRRRGAARTRGLPVDPRDVVGLPPAPARGGPRVRHVRRAGDGRGHARSWPAASSTRSTTSTACCSSTASTRRRASGRWPRSAPPTGSAGPRRPCPGGQGQPAPAVREGPVTAVGGSGSRLRLLFAGTPEAAVPSLRALLDSRHEVVAVLTRPDAPAGRGRRMVRSPVGALADEAGIPVLTPRRLSEPGFLDTLRTLSPDCGVIVAYGALVPRAALDVPRLRLGQPALLAPAGLARRRARAGRAAARRRDHRCRDLPAGGGPRHRPRVRGGHRGRRHHGHRGRPAGPPVGVRCRAAGRDGRRARGRHGRGPAAAGRGGLARTEGHRRRRAGRLGGARGGRRPAGPRRHPGARGVDDLPRRAPRSSARCARPTLPASPSSSPASCTPRSDGCSSEPRRHRWSWARSARSGAAPCPRPTGRAGCASRPARCSHDRATRPAPAAPLRTPAAAGPSGRPTGRRAAAGAPGARPAAGAGPGPDGRSRAAHRRPRAQRLREPRLPGDPAAARAARPRRRAGHRAGLRHAAGPGPARRGDRRLHRAPAAPHRAAAARRPAPGRLPAAAHPGAAARRGRHDRRARPGGRGLPLRRFRQRRAAPDRRARRGGLGGAARARPEGGRGRPRGAGPRAPAMGRAGVRRRPGRTRGGGARRRARRGRRPPVGAPARPARRDHRRGAGPGHRRRARAVLALRRAPRTGQRRHRGARRRPRGARGGAGRGQPARGAGADPRAGRRRRAPLARPLRRARRQVRAAGRARRPGGRHAGRRRTRRAPRGARAPGRRRAAGHRARRGRPHGAAARRRLRPGAGRRPVHRPGRPAAAARGAVAAPAGGRGRAVAAAARAARRGAAARAPGRRGGLRHLLAAPGGDRGRGGGRDASPGQAGGRRRRRSRSSSSTPGPTCRACPISGPARRCSCGRTGTARTRCSWPCCAAPAEPACGTPGVRTAAPARRTLATCIR